MDNIDFNKMLDMLANMDKSELEAKLKQAQAILNSKDINTNNIKKNDINTNDIKTNTDIFRK